MVSLRALINSGLRPDQNYSERRSTFLTNQISLILFGFSIILLVTYYHWYGWNFITLCIPVVSVIFLCPLLLNYKGYNTISRLLICLCIPLITMAVSIYSKI